MKTHKIETGSERKKMYKHTPSSLGMHIFSGCGLRANDRKPKTLAMAINTATVIR